MDDERRAARGARVRGGCTGGPPFSLHTVKPEGAAAEPQGGGIRTRGGVRVRGGSNIGRVRVRSFALEIPSPNREGLVMDSIGMVPRGGTTCGRGVRGRHVSDSVRRAARGALVRGGFTGGPPFSLQTVKPEGAAAEPLGGGIRTRGGVRVRGGSNIGRVRVRSFALEIPSPNREGLVMDSMVMVPRGGTRCSPDVRGSHDSDRLLIHDIEDMPLDQGLETPLHPYRKRQWQPLASAPQLMPPLPQMGQGDVSGPSPSPPPQKSQCNTTKPSPPPRPQKSRCKITKPSPPPRPQKSQCKITKPSPPPRPQKSQCKITKPSPPTPPQKSQCNITEPSPPTPPQKGQSPPPLIMESEPSTPHQASSDRPRQSLVDNNISYTQLCYGSDSDSDESDDDGDMMTAAFVSRVHMSEMETPLDVDDAGEETDGPVAAAAADDASTSTVDVPSSATDQPWGLYEFDWKPFPNVPIPPESRRETFSQSDVGPTAPCLDPYEIFVGIWDRKFMEYIAEETNRYAQQVTASMIETNNLHPNSRITKWRDTNADELYVYFGLIIAMGVVVKSRIDDYWTVTPDVFYTPGFSAHMSGHRFSLLSKCLHFVNNETMLALKLNVSEARLFKVQPLLSHLNNKFQSMYRLGQNIALDESLLQWKGLLDISQLIRNKAATVGIKTYELCESQTGYLWRFEVHGKSQRSPPQQFEDPMKATTPATVLRLIQGLEGKGHTLWMDNFYNSPSLARRLKGLGFDCVGTLRTNRKYVPQALHSLTKENMRRGQITGLTSGDVDVMVWRDNNKVAMISTYHGNGVSHIRGAIKPILINDYNIMMGGVDKKDQMLATYPVERKRTKVWYKKLFRRLLNVSVLNSYIIHRQSISSSSSSSPLSHRNFRNSLIKSLLSKHSSANLQPVQIPTHSNPLHDARSHHINELPFGEGQQRLRRKCVACRKLVQTFCVGCNKTMCMNPCFLVLHK